jgi:predicted nucleotidyltransferase
VDVSNPLRSIAPTVDADVLAVLARTHAPLTGLRVQQLAGRSYAQVRLVLHRLVEHGLVLSEQLGNTNSYVLNRDHVIADPLQSIVHAATTIEDELRGMVAGFALQPVAVVLFGSYARRDGDAASDIDILLVRADDVDAEDAAWVDQREALEDTLRGRSGNRVQYVELSASELDDAIARNEPLVESLRGDGVLVAGAAPGLAGLAGRLGAL